MISETEKPRLKFLSFNYNTAVENDLCAIMEKYSGERDQ